MDKQRGIFLLLMVALLGSCSGGGELQFTNGAVLSFSTTDFGERSFGTVSNLTVTVSNLGSRAASGLSTFAPTAPFGFAGGSFPGTGGTCVNSLGRGASCILVLSYTAPAPPVVNDSQTVLLTYSNGIGNPSASVTLRAQANNGSFNQARGFNLPVTAVAALSGGLFVGGLFESFSGNLARRIARFDSNASFDASFNSAAGTSAGFNGPVNSFAETQDGSGDVYVGGSFTSYNSIGLNRIARLNSDGSLDTTFSPGAGFDGPVYTLATAIDGSGDVYVGGAFTGYRGTTDVNRIVRLDSNGAIDTAFATGSGPTSGFDDVVNSIVVAKDGSGDVYVGGDFTIYQGSGANGIVRINSNGSPDSGFNFGTGFSSGQVKSIANATDGSGDIYVGGTFNNYDVTPNLNSIVRLNNDGSIEPTFSTGSGVGRGLMAPFAPLW